jgi:hypothetical protein
VEHKAEHEKCQDFRLEIGELNEPPHSKAAKAQSFEHGPSRAFICRSDLSDKKHVNLSEGARTPRSSLPANSLTGCTVRASSCPVHLSPDKKHTSI